MAKELYVGHISEQATEDDLRKLFEVMGVVTSVHLIVDEATGEFKRCGYVRMLSEVNLNEVVETLDGTWLVDRCIVVSVAVPQKDRPAKTPYVRRKPMVSISTAIINSAPGSKRLRVDKAGQNIHAVPKEAAKSGRSSSAQEAARKRRSAAAKYVAKSEHPAPSKRTGRLTGVKRQGDGQRPTVKGRR